MLNCVSVLNVRSCAGAKPSLPPPKSALTAQSESARGGLGPICGEQEGMLLGAPLLSWGSLSLFPAVSLPLALPQGGEILADSREQADRARCGGDSDLVSTRG